MCAAVLMRDEQQKKTGKTICNWKLKVKPLPLKLNFEIQNEVKRCMMITHTHRHGVSVSVQLIQWTLQFQQKLIITNICVNTNVWLCEKETLWLILTWDLTSFCVLKRIVKSQYQKFCSVGLHKLMFYDLHINMVTNDHQLSIEIHPKNIWI